MSPSTSAVYHCRFRSRLEARWAVFFDQLAIAWVYEPEGYVLSDGRRYLPDFHLPDCATWVEVKGHEAALDRQLMLTAARDLPGHSGRGEAGPLLMVLGPVPEPRPGRGDWGWMALDKGMADSVGPGGGWQPGQLRYGFGSYATNRRPWFLDNAQYEWTPDTAWTEPLWDVYESGVPDAYVAARSARFEHGESG